MEQASSVSMPCCFLPLRDIADVRKIVTFWPFGNLGFNGRCFFLEARALHAKIEAMTSSSFFFERSLGVTEAMALRVKKGPGF